MGRPQQDVRNFIDVTLSDHQMEMARYELATNFPRKVYDDPKATLKDAVGSRYVFNLYLPCLPTDVRAVLSCCGSMWLVLMRTPPTHTL